ncbi:MAG: SCP2 sterol-binding domain-containing protein [Alphaproteobacteria bacterium]|nr:SCP2 sterol-binding domain-containing protein [Alphaproteobacteria bacterium]
MTPPLSPVLLLGLPLSFVPRALLDMLLADVMRHAVQAYPRVFERLAGLTGAHVLIAPSDLPIGFELCFADGATTLRIAPPRAIESPASAVIRGPLVDLIALLQGRLDGDALFFSRHLTVEGDTSAVVALRNAVEGEEVDLLRLISERAGPFRALLRAGMAPACLAYRLLESALLHAQHVLEAPLRRDMAAYGHRLDDISSRLDSIERATARRRSRTDVGAP